MIDLVAYAGRIISLVAISVILVEVGLDLLRNRT
jgi:hypothetical protein